MRFVIDKAFDFLCQKNRLVFGIIKAVFDGTGFQNIVKGFFLEIDAQSGKRVLFRPHFVNQVDHFIDDFVQIDLVRPVVVSFQNAVQLLREIDGFDFVDLAKGGNGVFQQPL